MENRLPLNPFQIRPLPKNKGTYFFFLFLFSATLIQILAEIQVPFNCDEMAASRFLSLNEFKIFNPFLDPQNHAISNMMSWVFLQLFGAVEWASRLSGIFFTTLFLIAMVSFARKEFTIISSLLIFAHFFSNELLIWYFHSMRGYAALILFSFLIFRVFFNLTKEEPIFLSKKGKIVFSVFLFAPVLCHMFYGFFVILLSVSFCLWLLLKRVKKEPINQDHFFYLKVVLGWGALIFLAAIYQFFITRAHENLMGSGRVYEVDKVLLGFLFGVARSWYPKLWAMFLLFLFIGPLFKKRISTFPFIFLTTSAVAFVSAVYLFRSAFFARLILPWLIVFIILVLKEVERSSFLKQSISYLGLLFLLGFIPITHREEIVMNLGNMDRPQRIVAALPSRKIGPNCFSYSGDKDQTLWVRDFYLGNNSRFIDTAQTQCVNRYHFFFSEDITSGQKFTFNQSQLPNAKLLFTDVSGNQLYEY